MDPLSTTASIVAILQLSAKLVGYINTTAGATKDRKRLREEVRACSNILQELKDEADDFEEGKAWSHTIKTLEGPNAPLRRLHIALNLIRIKLQPKDGSVKALKWPFQEKGLQKIIETLEREKSLLSLALENNSRKLLQEIIKHSKENDRQLTELVELVKKSVQGNQDSVKELKDQLSSVEVLQTGTQDGINRLHEHQSSREASEERKAILDWLTPINYASQQYGFFNKRQSGTGQWVLESDVYQAWSKAEKQTLLCLGGPGVGKTILTSIMVDDIYERYREDPTVAVAYLYCDFGRQDEQTVDNLTASLLRQLAEGQSPLSKTMKDLYSKHEKKQTRPPLEDISEALQTVAASYSRVFILVDALDECQARTGCQTRFLLEIFGLQEKCNVNLLSTSRFTPEITWMFKGSETLEIRANSKDVRKYLDGRMFQLPDFVGHNRELQEEIKTMIVQSADGMFLLAQLHLDALMGEKSPEAVRAALKVLSTGSGAYDHAYRNAMMRIKRQVADQEELAKLVLSWITCAERPLTIPELQQAFVTDVSEPELDVDNFPQVEDMVLACAGLVTVDKESGIVRLVHHTAHEYFKRTSTEWFMHAKPMITRVCATYLTFNHFNTCNAKCMGAATEFEDHLQTDRLYNYAVKVRGNDARLTPSACAHVLTFMEWASSQASSFVRSWDYSEGFLRNTTGIRLAEYFRVSRKVTAALKRFVNLDVKDKYGGTPLSSAAARAHEAVVKLLLDGKAANAEDHYTWKPLLHPAQKGYEAVAKLLLNDTAAAYSYDNDDRTLLSYAAKYGHEAVVKLLLHKKATIETRDSCGQTPLSHAAKHGNRGVVKLLLNNRADVGSQDNMGWTPLSYAAENGHKAVIKLLLDHGAAVDQNGCGLTPLSRSAEHADRAVIKLLLNNGAAVDCQDDLGQTPLSYAAGFQNRAVIKVLLNNGAAVDSQNRDGRTPLSYAANHGNRAAVKVLLDHGAAVDSQNWWGRTPLSYAADNGYKSVVKLLLDHGAAVDFQDDDEYHGDEYHEYDEYDDDNDESIGRTPLSYAADQGNTAVAKLLLKHGAAIDSQDRYGRTPLSYAAVNGNTAVIDLLLNHGAAVDSQDKPSRTPLSYAAAWGPATNIKLLLDSKAAVGFKDERGRTPLWYAERREDEAIIKLLLDGQATEESKDEKDQTKLWYAEQRVHETNNNLLLDSKASVNSMDEKSQSKLWYVETREIKPGSAKREGMKLWLKCFLKSRFL